MNRFTLAAENQTFRGTRGVSQNAGHQFQPAFLDKGTGRVELARLKNGSPATCHLISWLPKEWATTINTDGTVEMLKPGIISGFESDGVFFTRDQVAEL